MLRTWIAIAIAVVAASFLLGADFFQEAHAKNAAAESAARPEELLSFPIRVTDADGKPVAGAVVTAWALRSSQGHGLWGGEQKGRTKPPQVVTDAEGRAQVSYPRYTYPDERVQTLEVTLSVDHPDFSYISYENVNVVPEPPSRHDVKLAPGAAVEIVPLEKGRPAFADNLYAQWSDDRSWKPGVKPTVTADGIFHLPRMAAGKQQARLLRMVDGRVTHFSPIIDLELADGAVVRREAELRPAIAIHGMLSADVPRPVKAGRLKANTLPLGTSNDSLNWFTWARIDEKGNFTIDAWPAGEPIQIIALCDGYIAVSGEAPSVVEKKPPAKDAFNRPQVFSAEELASPITLAMEPRVPCQIQVVDGAGAPLPGVKVGACPNVGWWNWGSQIYCNSLVRGEDLLVKRDYMSSIDDSIPEPFEKATDAQGRVVIGFPRGKKERLYVNDDRYELPVVRGSRDHEFVAEFGGATIQLALQPKGTEYLGDWDKLTGILFGCTGEECKRLLSDKAFRKKMERVGTILDAAKDPRDPKTLKTAYTEIAAGFDDLEDKEEAAKWRTKAAEQAAKLSSSAEESAAESKSP